MSGILSKPSRRCPCSMPVTFMTRSGATEIRMTDHRSAFLFFGSETASIHRAPAKLSAIVQTKSTYCLMSDAAK